MSALLLPPIAGGAPLLDVVHHCDALALLRALPSGSVDLIATDPPYMGVKDAAWDNQWATDAAYLDWLRAHLREMRRVLAPNGSLYLFASPRMAARVEVAVGECFNVLNNIRWIKEAGWHNKTRKEDIRGFLQPWEAVIFAEHFNSDNYARGESSYIGALDDLRGFLFEPLRSYLDGERIRAGVSFEDVRQMVGCAPGSGLPSHWFTTSQWILPTAEQFLKLQVGFNAKGGDYLRREYEDLRREYEDLRREYEDLRRPFGVTAFDQFTDVWNFTPVHSYDGKHECEKPVELMRYIVRSSSRPGDMVLDCFAGSGATLDAARQEGRRYIGCDVSAHWAGYARRRVSMPYTLPLFATLPESEVSA